MTVQDYHDLWKVDGTFNGSELDQESYRIPQLHGKYLNFLSNERQNLKRFKREHTKIEHFKYSYYEGRISSDKLQELGIKPFPHKLLKSDIDRYVKSDDEVQNSKERIDNTIEKIEVLESILDNINKRTFMIRSAIDWQKFTNGVI